MRLKDIPKLSPNSFTWENMARRNVASPCRLDSATGRIVITSPWVLVGWGENIDDRLMHGREGQIVLMFHHPEHNELWEHYPLFDQEDRDGAVFEYRPQGC